MIAWSLAHQHSIEAELIDGGYPRDLIISRKDSDLSPIEADRVLANQWEAILANTSVEWPSEFKGKVIFATVYSVSSSIYSQLVHCVLGLSLKLRGMQPYVLSCDGVLPACFVSPLGITFLRPITLSRYG